jgi:hypothetical protein
MIIVGLHLKHDSLCSNPFIRLFFFLQIVECISIHIKAIEISLLLYYKPPRTLPYIVYPIVYIRAKGYQFLIMSFDFFFFLSHILVCGNRRTGAQRGI